MTGRTLSRDEWPAKLAGTDLEPVLDALPADTRVIVVEDAEGHVVAHWALIRYLHVEVAWVQPEYRGNPRVAIKLLRQLNAEVGADRAVWTCSTSEQVDGLLEKLHAEKLPGTHYVFPVGSR